MMIVMVSNGEVNFEVSTKSIDHFGNPAML